MYMWDQDAALINAGEAAHTNWGSKGKGEERAKGKM